MAALNPLTRELVFKIVYYGPGLGGKTTTLQHVHATAKPEHRGKMVTLATDTDRTLYFDYVPLQVLRLRNLSVRLQLFTVPGQVYYSATRKLVLAGADGIVFVADSQNARLDANQESLDDLNANLAEHGRALSQTPHAFNWNKRDLPDIVPPSDLDRRLNLFSAPSVETVATQGLGVFEGLEQITKLVFNAYKSELPQNRRENGPLFLDAEDVGLADAIRDLVDPQRMPASPAPPMRPRLRSEPDFALRPRNTPATGSSPSIPVPSPLSPSAQASPVATPAAVAPSAVSQSAVTAPLSPVLPPSPATDAAGSPPSGLAGVTTEHFTLAALWPEEDREAVRRAETLIGAGDAPSAVLACEALLTRVLATASVRMGTSEHARDPALLALLLGLDGPRYIRFRSLARAARYKREVTPRDALDGYVLALDARRALDRIAR